MYIINIIVPCCCNFNFTGRSSFLDKNIHVNRITDAQAWVKNWLPRNNVDPFWGQVHWLTFADKFV